MTFKTEELNKQTSPFSEKITIDISEAAEFVSKGFFNSSEESYGQEQDQQNLQPQ